MAVKRICFFCGRKTRVRTNGLFYKHTFPGTRNPCPNSWGDPTATPEEDEFGDEFDWDPPGDWRKGAIELWNDVFGRKDEYAEALFHAGYFDTGYEAAERSRIRNALQSHLANAYGIDFERDFDWAVWREAYGQAA